MRYSHTTTKVAVDRIEPVCVEEKENESPDIEKKQIRNWRYKITRQDDSFLEAAHDIFRYLDSFMLDSGGGYYTSQDADLSLEVDGHAFFPLSDNERRALGIPRIDTHIYTRENAWLIRALLDYYNASGNQEAFDRALGAARFIIEHRRLPGGGFSHGDNDSSSC